MVQQSAVVPHDGVAGGPTVTVHSLPVGGPLEQVGKHLTTLLAGKVHDVVGVGPDDK